MSRTYVAKRKRNKTDSVKRLGLAGVKAKRDWVEAPNQHIWRTISESITLRSIRHYGEYGSCQKHRRGQRSP
jgi:hypothetical protein